MVNLITTDNLLGCIKNVRDAGDTNRPISGYSEASILAVSYTHLTLPTN